MGQLKTAFGKEAGGSTNRLHTQFGYNYDPAGNLTQRTSNALVQTFNVNSVNQLTTGTRNGTFTVPGVTTGPATNVTVNDVVAERYGDNSFARTNVTLNDGSNTFTAVARNNLGRADTNSLTVNLPATVTFQYDANDRDSCVTVACFASSAAWPSLCSGANLDTTAT